MRLSDMTCRTLPQPPKGQKTYFDETLRGFGFRVSQGGTRSFVLMHGPNRELVTIGRYPIISLSEARGEAKRILAERTLGKHQPDAITWDKAKDTYLEHVERKNRPRTHRDYKRLLERHFNFGRRQLSDITTGDINRKLDKLSNVPSEQNHALTALKIFFKWAERKSYVDRSPCQHLQLNKMTKRKRVLTDEELKAVWTAAGQMGGHFGTIIRLLMLTGQRKGEISALQKAYYSHNHQTLCLPDTLTKNGREHLFPIGPICISLLRPLVQSDATFLFPARGKKPKPFVGFSKLKKALDELSGVTAWRVHDLRRTYRTNLGKLGVAPHIAERLLNHIDAQSELEVIYDQWKYLPEMRDAMERWEGHFQGKIIV